MLTIRDANQELNFIANKKLVGTWPAIDDATTYTIQSSGSSAGNIALATGNSEIMRLTSGGNVGIGTPTPTGKLEVVGNTVLRTGTNRKTTFHTLSSLADVDGDTSYASAIGFSRGSDGVEDIAGLGLYNDENLFVGAYGDIVFGADGNGLFQNAPERMRLTAAGLGIGTATPTVALNVDKASTGDNLNLALFNKSGATGYGSAYISIGDAGQYTDIETNSGSSGPFRYNTTYADTMISNRYL